MAKKVVATLKKADSRNLVKVIKMVKSEKSDSYTFKEDIISKEFTGEFSKINSSLNGLFQELSFLRRLFLLI
jgi:predicted ATPase